MAGSTYAGMKEDFGVGEEVCILSISLFVAGLGCGPRESLFRDGLRGSDVSLLGTMLGVCGSKSRASLLLHRVLS